MPLDLILAYCWDAAKFALPFGIGMYCGRTWKEHKGSFDRKRAFLEALCVTYIAALLKITAIRQANLFEISLFNGTDSLLLIPLQTTLKEWRRGLWPFIYHAIGNTGWFVPLGMFARGLWKDGWKRSFSYGFFLSLFIEVMQYLLQSGISDVDDLIFNSLGSLLGWLLYGVFLALYGKLCYSKEKRGEE